MYATSFILFLMIGVVCAWLAEYMAPERIYGGLLAAIGFGVIGAWVGSFIVAPFGPAVAGIALMPTVIGSIVVIGCSVILSGMLKTSNGRG